ncbi:MAG: cytochrome c [Chloroflexi bacterium]|nr:cytochrome c [Chloroflexota bacterium]
MKKIFKWIGVVLGGLIGLIVLLAIGLYFVGNARMNKTYNIQPEAVTIPTDEGSIERGQRWARSLGCTGCHGEDLSGTVMFDDPALGYIPVPNLTAGEGGAGRDFTDADWILAVRHGIDPHEGRPLLGMPSGDYSYMTDEDLGELIAFLKSAPPVENDLGEIRLTFLAKVMLAAGAFGEEVLSAEIIDHSGAARPSPVEPGASVEYGDYLVRIVGCRTCHGAELAGGKHPEPGAPPGPNITPGGSFGEWSLEDFRTAAATRQSKYMPWEAFAGMSNHELEAIYLYLQSLPALENAIK